jgi:hypothetical protein
MKATRLFLALLTLLLACASSFAGILTVTSPTSGSGPGADDSPFLGKTNTLRYNITEASVEVTVTAVITGPGYTNTLTGKLTPDVDGKGSGTLTWTFPDATEEGDYTIVVSATEPGNTYETKTLYVKVDIEKPKILEFTPANATFHKGIVRIYATIEETNIKEWRVRVGDADIPNNVGTNNVVDVNWDTSTVPTDGSQRITITVTDKADNEVVQTINVTIDRIPPVITIAFPRSDTVLRPGTIVNVIVDVRDVTNRSVDATGIDVIATKLDGTYMFRIPRVSTTTSGSDTLRWIGRIRHRPGLPSQFKIVVNAVDKAGNRATSQSVTITFR